MLADDRLEIEGLAAILDEDTELPYLDLTLRYGARSYRVAVLLTEDGWTVNVRDSRGKSVPGSGEFYPDQGSAVLAASLIAIESARWPSPVLQG
jgi:hypothetical protein